MSQNTESLEVINKDQADLIDQSKALLAAHATAEKSTHVYLFALGARLHALKSTCQHGQFEKLKAAHFPSEARSTMGRAMSFSDAIQYLGKGKYPTVGYLGQGELLLSDGVIPDKDRIKAAAELDQIMKSRGVVDTIKTYFKKTAPKPEPMDAVKKEEQFQQTVEDSFADAAAKLEWVLHWKPAEYVLGSKAARAALAAACIRFGQHERAMQQMARTPKGTK